MLQTEYFEIIILPILIFLARIIDVTIGTFRIVMVARGKKYIAPLLGFIEVVIWIVAIGKIMENLDNWVNIVAYAGGFATGNYIGLFIEEKVAMGVVKIQIITAKSANDLIAKLKAAGYGITHHEATGANGKVSILYSIINRADVPMVIDMISTYNPNAFYSIEDVKFVNRGVDAMFANRKNNRKGK